MRKLSLLLLILVFNSQAFCADILQGLSNSYERGTIPDFLPHVGKALHGRCYMTDSNKKIASVLMVSFEEDGFELAPFDVERGPEDYLDKMSYREVLRYFPIIKKSFMWVSEAVDNATVSKTIGADEYLGEIRETTKFIVMRVYVNNKITKICNYSKW